MIKLEFFLIKTIRFLRDLSKNQVYMIEPNVFRNLTNLKRLNLSSNKITTLNEGSFNGLVNLERL